MELRSTANWSDVRFRQYTSSVKMAERFKKFPKINFTDSGHGIVPHVSEHSGPRRPSIRTLWENVEEHMRRMTDEQEKASRKAQRGAVQRQLDLAREEIARLTVELERVNIEFERYKKHGPGSKGY